MFLFRSGLNVEWKFHSRLEPGAWNLRLKESPDEDGRQAAIVGTPICQIRISYLLTLISCGLTKVWGSNLKRDTVNPVWHYKVIVDLMITWGGMRSEPKIRAAALAILA